VYLRWAKLSHRWTVTFVGQGAILITNAPKFLLELLDGTRDFAALVEAMAAVVQAGKATLEANGEPVSDPAKIREMIAEELPSALNGLARSAILVG
jgi:methyltransferase-like protein